jgi:hypothetical protein
VVTSTTGVKREPPQRVVSAEEILAFQRFVRRVPVSEPVARYALSIVRASRPEANGNRDFVRDWVAYGASVRAAQFLVLGGKARALTRGRFAVSYEDIRELAHPILRHRILTNFQAQSEGITTDKVIDLLLESVPQPRSGDVGSGSTRMGIGHGWGRGQVGPGARFLDPRVLQRIGNLELVARGVVEGFLQGLHRSPFLGQSLDFAEHRPYTEGTIPGGSIGGSTPAPAGIT